MLVVGAVNVDLVVAAPRLPGPGETVVGDGMERFGGGKGANAAVAAARAGAAVVLVGAVGDDDLGAAALDELRAEGVDVSGVAVLPGRATGVALIVVDAAGENQIAVGAGANAHVPASVTVPPGTRCVLVSTEINDDAVLAALRTGIPCVLNPAPVTDAVVAALDAGPILTPNRGECLDLAARLGAPTDEVGVAARRIRERTGAPVVVTLGGAGALVVDSVVETVPAPTATVRDTTGAGDTFNGVLAARLAAGDALADAVRVAVRAASVSVGAVGARAGMPTG
ncbi:bifunctional hydroxymethylpyrimidine kinase/phosphomethylpyrimidine kinase [Pseudonocardia abyssalis]|uniref:Ribokinase n=1 Tax=Pseudonocardia abyssalis TaxID=2792008 RepID=A0ABS6UU64_9PSEU|nr:bifunctional hydroxymethylpyrimidine kinase/phosphomethylpyrimidine kinase [Pseudonocardia abyssalis]